MIKDFEWKPVAPDIDRLVGCFDRGLLNPSAPTAELLSAMDPLFDALLDLQPLKGNNEAKAIWIMVPRGDIKDYGDYDELKEYGEVSSYEEFERLWREEYPNEISWYRLFVVESKGFRGIAVNHKTVVSARIDEDPVEFFHNSDAAEILVPLLTDAARRSMDLLRNGTYNETVASSLPYMHRTGVIRRDIAWNAEPKMKENIFEGLSEETFKTFERLVISGENDEKRIGRLKTMTANDFLNACAIGYKACGYKGCDLSPAEQYMMHADGRDEGLTGKGHGLHEGPGIDPGSPEAFEKWYFDRSRGGGHPWEVCRGGNSTHVSLYVRNDKKDITLKKRLGEITKEEADEALKHAGYFFEVAGSAWNRAVESVKFYVSIKEAGLPVILYEADPILSRLKGEDYIGIVPHRVFPAYCEDMFPDRYGTILDFMHVYDEDMESFGDKIEWLPEDEARLIS